MESDSGRKLRYAEERIEMLDREKAELRASLRRLEEDRNVDKLKDQIEAINRYDEQVAMIISADPNLQEAWDNFRCLYQLMARKELLVTAREKANGMSAGVCHACKRTFTEQSPYYMAQAARA